MVIWFLENRLTKPLDFWLYICSATTQYFYRLYNLNTRTQLRTPALWQSVKRLLGYSLALFQPLQFFFYFILFCFVFQSLSLSLMIRCFALILSNISCFHWYSVLSLLLVMFIFYYFPIWCISVCFSTSLPLFSCACVPIPFAIHVIFIFFLDYKSLYEWEHECINQAHGTCICILISFRHAQNEKQQCILFCFHFVSPIHDDLALFLIFIWFLRFAMFALKMQCVEIFFLRITMADAEILFLCHVVLCLPYIYLICVNTNDMLDRITD